MILPRGKNKKETVTMVLAFVAVLLLTIFIYGPAVAEAQTMTGKVVAIDMAAKTISIDSFEGKAAGVHTFKLRDNVSVAKKNEQAAITDIAIGDLVTVTYHQGKNGPDEVDGIAITSEVPEEET